MPSQQDIDWEDALYKRMDEGLQMALDAAFERWDPERAFEQLIGDLQFKRDEMRRIVDRALQQLEQSGDTQAASETLATLPGMKWQREHFHPGILLRQLATTKVHRPWYQKGPIRPSLRTQVYERDGYRCVECHDWHNLSIDHIYPERLGGPTALDNLQTLCRSCNSRKGDRTP